MKRLEAREVQWFRGEYREKKIWRSQAGEREEPVCYLAVVLADFYIGITVGLCPCRDGADY